MNFKSFTIGGGYPIMKGRIFEFSDILNRLAFVKNNTKFKLPISTFFKSEDDDLFLLREGTKNTPSIMIINESDNFDRKLIIYSSRVKV
jgi:hypothetical protein